MNRAALLSLAASLALAAPAAWSQGLPGMDLMQHAERSRQATVCGAQTPSAPDAETLQKIQTWAGSGVMVCQHYLGLLQERGLGVPADPVAAFGWYQKAAEQSDLAGIKALARAYASGVGTAPNPAEAQRWYGMAAARNDVDAMLALGELAYSGQPRNADAAGDWFRKAATRGNFQGWMRLAEIEQQGYTPSAELQTADFNAWRSQLTTALQGTADDYNRLVVNAGKVSQLKQARVLLSFKRGAPGVKASLDQATGDAGVDAGLLKLLTDLKLPPPPPLPSGQPREFTLRTVYEGLGVPPTPPPAK